MKTKERKLKKEYSMKNQNCGLFSSFKNYCSLLKNKNSAFKAYNKSETYESANYKHRNERYNNMEITETLVLKDSYVTHPADWETLHNVLVPDKEAEHAAMIGVTNSHIYKVPVFIFGSDKERIDDYPEEYIHKLYAACEELCPGFTDVVKLEPDPSIFNDIDISNPYDIARVKEIMTKLPHIIIYPVHEIEDPIFGEIEEVEDAPYGVVLRRIQHYTGTENHGSRLPKERHP